MDVFIARQPIFRPDHSVYGYELLFRDSLENAYPTPDPDEATSKVILRGFMVLDIEAVTGGLPAFINVSREALVSGLPELLRPELVVLEILESVPADPEVLASLRRLRDAGYRIALDDFEDNADQAVLAQFANLIKIDFLATPPEVRREIMKTYAERDIRFVAEKIETRADMDRALDEGFDLLQGYFFSRPVILTGKDIPIRKAHYLRMTEEIRKRNLDLDAIEDLVKSDLSLCHKLLHYTNHSGFRFGPPVASVRDALVCLGEEDVRRWITLLSLASLGDDKPDELVRECAARGRFCEALASAFGLDERKDDLLLLGLFSNLEALLDVPVDRALARLALPDDLRAALRREESPLLPVLDLVEAYERGNWREVERLQSLHDFDIEELPGLYADALKLGNEGFGERVA